MLQKTPEYKHVDEKNKVSTDMEQILALEEDPGIQAPEEDVCDNDYTAGGDSPSDDGGGDKIAGNDGNATIQDEGEDPEVRRCLKSGQTKLTQIVQRFLFTGMLTMILLMTQ